jgi:putative spermidine/putrescine transport system permease protein
MVTRHTSAATAMSTTVTTTPVSAPSGGLGRGLSRWLHPKRRTRIGALIGAPALWLLVMYIGSLLALFLNSAYRLNEDGSGIDKTLSTDNFHEITRSVYRDVAVRTIGIAVAVTVIDIVLALPLAFFIAKLARRRWRSVMVAAVLVPLWASYLVKAFAWRALVGSPGGVLDATFGRSPGYGEVALVVVLAYLWLPYMVIPIYAGFERLPDSLLEASGDLGARFGATFRRVVLPMVVPSVVAGSIFTFSLSLGDYIAVGLVGGKTQMIGSVVYSNFASNLPLAAAFALVPVLVMVLYLVAVRRSGALEHL